MKQEVFNTDWRIPREKYTGAPGFIEVKAGTTPESYGLAPADCVGLLVEAALPFTEDELELDLDIATCIRQMIEADPEQKDTDIWTHDKKPKVRVIEGVIKKDITPADRNAAWEQYIKEVNNG